MSVSLEEAYAACEMIAHREAKNFYYAFRVLPKPKRAAICAVYAFMRHADDLADDEQKSREERLQQTQNWLDEWHRASTGEDSDNPVFIALRDTQHRFQISTELLDQLVQGTRMDLTASTEQAATAFPDQLTTANRESLDNFESKTEQPPANDSMENLAATSQISFYRTFDDLYRYCYFVASVVGLVCIRIFGYTDQRAEKMAEETGIAFQLTNILRDIREDVERGRLYLPMEDLRRYNVTFEHIVSMRDDRKLTLDERALMEMEVERARKYYGAADSLLPFIAPDSRAALWVLVKIYRRLLERIVDANYEVFSTRVSVPTHEKVGILLSGMWMAFRLRNTRNN